MKEIYNQLGIGLVCASIFIAGIIWQLRVWKKCFRDEGARKRTFMFPAYLGMIVCLAVGLATLGFWILSSIDGSNRNNADQLYHVCTSVIAISIAFFLKSCFSAMLISSAVTWTAWCLMVHGELSFIPIFKMVFKSVSSGLPPWVLTAYIFVTFGYCIFSSLSASVDFHDAQ